MSSVYAQCTTATNTVVSCTLHLTQCCSMAQASRLCESGTNVLEPVAVVVRDCSSLWHLLKVQLIPYYVALHDHGMDERSMQLLLLEIPDCHPVSQSAEDSFFPIYKALSATTPFSGSSLPEVSRLSCVCMMPPFTAISCHSSWSWGPPSARHPRQLDPYAHWTCCSTFRYSCI